MGHSSIMPQIRLDYIIINAVDSFNFWQEADEDREKVQYTVEQSPKVGHRVGSITTEARRLLMELMPLAATQIIE